MEEITLHPDDPLPAAFRVMLCGGLALMLGGVAITIWRAFRAVARERLVCAAFVAAVALAANSWPGVMLLLTVVAAIAAMLVAEHRRIEM